MVKKRTIANGNSVLIIIIEINPIKEEGKYKFKYKFQKTTEQFNQNAKKYFQFNNREPRLILIRIKSWVQIFIKDFLYDKLHPF